MYAEAKDVSPASDGEDEDRYAAGPASSGPHVSFADLRNQLNTAGRGPHDRIHRVRLNIWLTRPSLPPFFYQNIKCK